MRLPLLENPDSKNAKNETSVCLNGCVLWACLLGVPLSLIASQPEQEDYSQTFDQTVVREPGIAPADTDQSLPEAGIYSETKPGAPTNSYSQIDVLVGQLRLLGDRQLEGASVSGIHSTYAAYSGEASDANSPTIHSTVNTDRSTETISVSLKSKRYYSPLLRTTYSSQTSLPGNNAVEPNQSLIRVMPADRSPVLVPMKAPRTLGTAPFQASRSRLASPLPAITPNRSVRAFR